MTLFTYSVPRLGASSFAILANTELVVVVSIGVLVLGEAMTPWRAVGGALIVAGIVAHVLGAGRSPTPEAADELRPSSGVRARRTRRLIKTNRRAPLPSRSSPLSLLSHPSGPHAAVASRRRHLFHRPA